MATIHCGYGTTSVLDYELDALGESHCSFCNMTVTSVVMAGETCRTSLYSIDFGGVVLDSVVPH